MTQDLVDRSLTRRATAAVAITPLGEAGFKRWLSAQSKTTARWVKRTGFTAAPGSHCLLSDRSGGLARVLAGIDGAEGPWAYAGLAAQLPKGRYRIDAELDAQAAENAALGWALSAYRFTRYKAAKGTPPILVWPPAADRAAVGRAVEATALIRDLVNTPAGDLGPGELADAAKAVARTHKAKVSILRGDDLLKKGYPAIHAVGRASTRAPRLIDLRWGSGPLRVTLVGKGVCFDSGGLDLKSARGMLLMKKDMGGAAHALGLAQMIMAAGLPLRLRVLIPAVENSVSGNAFRPLDVLQTRKGITVEVGNTDAEGRLILCDALAEADSEEPDLILDFATLTGAARAALGTDLPALFCDHEAVVESLLRHGCAQHDLLWRLPLHRPYRQLLDSKIADINNVTDGGQGGAITAALFLSEFVSRKTPWAHIDLMAWNPRARPGRPVGGEAMGLRAAFAFIAEHVQNRA